MVQEISTKPSMFGRLGQGLAQGLVDTVPKEVERQRLQSGLKQLEQDSPNLSPMQFLTRSLGIPGSTPEITRQLGEFARHQSFRKSLQGGNANEQPSFSENGSIAEDPRVAAAMQQMGMKGRNQTSNQPISSFKNREDQARSQPSTNQDNPNAPKYLPAEPLDQAGREKLLDRLSQKYPYATFPELNDLADKEEQRRMQNPKAYQERIDYITNRENQAEDLLDKQLKTSLHKDDLEKDLTGDTLLDLKKSMNNDLATDPHLTPKQAAEKWRRIAGDFVRSKNKVNKEGERTILDRISPNGKKETLKNLSVAQQHYAELGKQKELADTLATDGWDLSPGKRALIAYPRSENLKGLLHAFNVDDVPINQLPSYASKLASDFIKNKTSDDSVLAFAQAVKDKSSFFDQEAFFDYLRENIDKLTPDQKLEIQEGVKGLRPTWGNLALFPLTGSSVLHD